VKTSYINRAGRELLGLGEDEDVSRYPVFDTDFEDQKERFDSVILPGLLRGEPWNGEFRLLHAQTGERSPWTCEAFGVFGAYGQLLGFAASAETSRRGGRRRRRGSGWHRSWSSRATRSSANRWTGSSPRGTAGRNRCSATRGGGGREADYAAGVAGYERTLRELLRRVGTEDIVEHYEDAAAAQGWAGWWCC